MNGRRAAPILLALAVLVGAGFVTFLLLTNDDGSDAAPTAIPVITTESDNIVEGRVTPANEAALAFTIGGEVAEILVEEGARVQAGIPLIRLFAEDKEIALRQAQADLEAAGAELDRAGSQLQAAQASTSAATVDVQEAQAQQVLVEAGARPEEITAAQQAVEAAQFAVVEARSHRSDLLATPDSEIRTAEARVAAARAQVETLQDQYDAILDSCVDLPGGNQSCPLYGTTEEQVRAQLEEAQIMLEAAQAAFDALTAGPTAGQRQAADGAVLLAEANLGVAEARLVLLQAAPAREETEVAEALVRQAQAAVALADARVVEAEAGVSRAEAGLLRAQAVVSRAQALLDQATLVAPFGGTIAAIEVEVGQQVTPAAPVIILADSETWHVETTELDELQVVSVYDGMAVTIRLEAIPGEVLQGEVIAVAQVSELVRGEITYPITIRLEDSGSLPLRWGMTAAVEFDFD